MPMQIRRKSRIGIHDIESFRVADAFGFCPCVPNSTPTAGRVRDKRLI
jgi:hypothetical protein